MTEENNVTPEQPQPQPEPIKEEEVVEVPVDISLFDTTIESVVKMLIRAQGVLEGSATYDKLASELAVICQKTQDILHRTLQLHELDSVLAEAKFTNKSSVDAKIRKRVIEELTKRFKFVRIGDEVVDGDDVVVLENDIISTQPVVEKPQPVIASPPRDLSEAASREKIRREARREAMQEVGVPPHLASIYERALEEDNAPVQMEVDDQSSEDDMTPEEIRQYFGASATNPQEAAKIESLKGRIKAKTLKSGPIQRGKNTSITRK